jgi:putative peptidoglycan binding protein
MPHQEAFASRGWGIPQRDSIDRAHATTNTTNMKKLISLLIGCSLGLAGAALAQQPVEQQPPSKGKQAPQKAHATQAQPGSNVAKPEQRPAQQTGAMKERGATKERGAMNERTATTEPGAEMPVKQTGAMKQRSATSERTATTATNEPGAEKGRKTHAGRESAKAPETNVSGESTSAATNEPGAGKGRKARTHQESVNAPTSNAKQQAEQQRKGVKAPATAAKTSANPAAAGTNAVSPTSATGQQNAQARGTDAVKKPAPQQVQQVKSQHANFRAQPKPQQVPSVTFNQNNRIQGSEQWQGAQYQVFRSYQPQWHDEGWYRSHYGNVVLIGGGYYYLNNGYWFPAWGYSASAQYYPYDGPIYAGHGAQPPDQVIAETQSLLQQMGYYNGEVDGLLGPMTREALAAYQADNGLTATASIDEPTLDSLGLA